jgi:hypothetical protein
MRDMGVRGIVVYCADYHCSCSTANSADRWPDDVRLSDIEPRFICGTCGKRGADVRPDFNRDKISVRQMRLSLTSKTLHHPPADGAGSFEQSRLPYRPKLLKALYHPPSRGAGLLDGGRHPRTIFR